MGLNIAKSTWQSLILTVLTEKSIESENTVNRRFVHVAETVEKKRNPQCSSNQNIT